MKFSSNTAVSNLGAGSTAGIIIQDSDTGLGITNPVSAVADFRLLGAAGNSGFRLLTGNVIGTTDVLIQPQCINTGWTIYSNLNATCQGISIVTNGALPITFRPGNIQAAGVTANNQFFFDRTDTTLANGDNNNVAVAQSFKRITGPTGAFAVTGFTNGRDGAILYVLNSTAQTFTIKNENAGSTAANRITTLTGADVVLRATATSAATFIYDGSSSRWILMGINGIFAT